MRFMLGLLIVFSIILIILSIILVVLSILDYMGGLHMERFYYNILAWSIMKLVNRQKTYQARCKKLNGIINALVDEYSDYSRKGVL